MLVVWFDGYVYAVPYIQQADGSLFLKTVFPSRKLMQFYVCVKKMSKTPEIGAYPDDEEKAFIEAHKEDGRPPKSGLTSERRAELQAMANATINDEREKISLRISRADLTRLKSRALQEGIPYQTLINSIIHKYVSR